MINFEGMNSILTVACPPSILGTLCEVFSMRFESLCFMSAIDPRDHITILAADASDTAWQSLRLSDLPRHNCHLVMCVSDNLIQKKRQRLISTLCLIEGFTVFPIVWDTSPTLIYACIECIDSFSLLDLSFMAGVKESGRVITDNLNSIHIFLHCCKKYQEDFIGAFRWDLDQF